MKLPYKDITASVIEAAFRVHNALGSGYLEKVYQNAMMIELTESGLRVAERYPIDVYYRGQQVGEFIADLFVEDCILVELKAVENLHPYHEAQLVNYLTATGVENGLLINFGTSVVIKRKFKTYRKPRPDMILDRLQD